MIDVEVINLALAQLMKDSWLQNLPCYTSQDLKAMIQRCIVDAWGIMRPFDKNDENSNP